jgi:hypothetical protein
MVRQAPRQVTTMAAPLQSPQARHWLGQTAGNDEIEHVQINVDIESKAMSRDALAHRDAD